MNPKITVYTLPSCVQCRLTERRLADRALPFEHVSLEADPAAAERFRAAGYLQAPIVEVTTGAESIRWSGFRPDLIDAIPTEAPAA